MYLKTLIAGLIFFMGGCVFGDEAPAVVGPAAAGAMVVVELFTSEGCSSCPPADVVLASIANDARANKRKIYAIAWHVDYWNRLGWSDPFSSAEASMRQQKYADAFKSDTVYTPQMIVNGRVQFVGSDSDKASREIAAALSHTAGAEISINLGKVRGNQITIDYTTQHAPANAVLEVVAVERGLTTHVMRGENGGRTLHHENVVRANQEIVLTGKSNGHITLTLPPDADPGHVSIIGFIQDPESMVISGAAQVDLPSVAR